MSALDHVLRFYDEHPINERQIEAALRREGKDPAGPLSPEDLFPHDQDHYGGTEVTEELARRAGIGPGQVVLDVCSGMGGPARLFAHRFGARVVGVDLNRGRVAGAARLTRRAGLAGSVAFAAGDATALPFRAAAFDACLSQEAFLHVPDKPRLLAELSRVLKPGGRLAFTDWVAGPGLSAADRDRLAAGIAASAIPTREAYLAMLAAAGFRDAAVEDLSPLWRRVLRQRLKMFRSLGPDTAAQFGEARQRAYIEAYEFFVGRIESGDLGGGRFVAAR